MLTWIERDENGKDKNARMSLAQGDLSRSGFCLRFLFFCFNAIANWVLERCVILKCMRMCVAEN